MKALVSIVVLLFVSFLAAPTIVSLLDDDTDTTVVYGFSEEEVQKELKEVKVGCVYIYEDAFIPVIKKSSDIPTENLQRHESVCGDIFIPPPEC